MVSTKQSEFDLPDQGQMAAMLRGQVDFWQPRNQLIDELRKTRSGENPVKAPSTTQYKVVVKHTQFLEAITNEKVSRFDDLPAIKITPVGDSGDARKFSTKMEKNVNGIWGALRRQSGGNVWSRQVEDAILTDGGCARIERAPAAMWPELTIVETKGGEKSEKLYISRPFENEKEYEKYREEYKESCHIPLRQVFVPHECFFPHYDGPVMTWAQEIEQRNLVQIMRNPLFYGSTGHSMLASFDDGSSKQLNRKVVLMHYIDSVTHAYYALVPGSNSNNPRWPDALKPTELSIGTPVLLHSYKHRLGRTLYNYIAGRAGGFMGSNSSQSEGVMKAILELSRDGDEVWSQIATNLRSTAWPTLVAYYSKENRAADDGLPAPPKIQEGQNIAMWADERLENAIKPIDINAAQWFMSQIRERIGELAGSQAIFGSRQPGVTTGYHESLQISQAEHLDNKIEQNVAEGAVDATVLFLKHIEAMDEKVPVWTTERSPKYGDIGSYGWVTPEDVKRLRPAQIAARVRTPRDTDYPVKLQAFMQATADRRGPGTPAMDDDTARDVILGLDAPDEVQRKIDRQNIRQRIMDAGFIDQKVMEKLSVAVVKAGTPTVTGDMAAQADPALQQATQMLNGPGGEAEQTGGVAPNLLAAQMEGRQEAGVPSLSSTPSRPTPGGVRPRNGMGGGLARGMAQPVQTAGRGDQLLRGGP